MARVVDGNGARSFLSWWPTYVAFGFVVLGAVAVVFLPELLLRWRGVRGGLTPAEYQTALAATSQTVLFCLGGAIAVFGLALSLYRHRRDEGAARRDLDANWTARYTEAIGQLGDESVTIRIGAIFALERIAEDSLRDRQTVLDVLLLFIKEASPWKAAMDDEEYEFRERGDVSAAALAASRITTLSPPFRVVELARANLFGTSWRAANLRSARLDGSIFSNADFRGARLDRASLSGARFDHSPISGAHFENALGDRISFKFAQARGADLTAARFVNGSFHGADFAQAVFRRGIFSGAAFAQTTLARADFTRARLADTTWPKAMLRDAVFDEADLDRADFSGAVGLRPAQFATALWTDRTVWPDGFDPEGPGHPYSMKVEVVWT